MNAKRTAALLVVGGALAVWLASAANSGLEDVQAPRGVRTPPIDSSGAALASEIARLHEHLRPTAAPRQPSRNLFSFAAHRPAAAPAPAAEIPRVAPNQPPPRPPAPPLKLSGIAEDQTPNGPVRTAIMSMSGQLFLVKEGEPVTDRFRVIKIAPDVVELSDLTENTTIRLALK